MFEYYYVKLQNKAMTFRAVFRRIQLSYYTIYIQFIYTRNYQPN